MSEQIDEEIGRWQEAIRDKLIDLGAPADKIDGAGCDSGDPLDFTLTEIEQGVSHFKDQLSNGLPPFPEVMGRPVTRAEIIEGLRDCQRELNSLKRRVEPGFVSYPDMETILDYIEENGLPPNQS